MCGGIYAARCRRAEDKSDKKRDRFVDRATSDRQLPSDLRLREPLGEESLDCLELLRTARFEYRRWPPRRPFFGGTHAAIASSLSQIVTSPRLLRPRSYSLQFRILYFFLYWRLTRLDFAATMTLPPRSL